MKSTSDIMVKSAGTKWKQIESHVNRTQPYYSNQNIDIHRSGKNMYGHLDNYKKLMDQQFLPYLRAYNHKCIKQRKKSRMYGIPKKNGKGYRKYNDPVSDYLRRSHLRNERMVIFELGNKDIRKRYYKVLHDKFQLTTAQIRHLENLALIRTAKIWNKNNKYLKITDFATNTDEDTAHIHTRMAVVNLYGKSRDMAVKSEKKRGIHHYIRKPLMSFNRALIKTYPQAVNDHGRPDNREAIKAMRKRFDPVIIKSFDHELAKHSIGLHLDLVRTGKANHFTLRAYQAHKDMQRVYGSIACQIKLAFPNMKHDHKPATDQNYYNLATGQEHVRFRNGTSASGADLLSIHINQSLHNKKRSIKANYRSNAVDEAQPMINNKIAESTADIKDSADSSASASASQLASTKVSSLNSSIASSQAEWTSSMNNQLFISASRSASAKVNASIQASMATSEAQLRSSSDSLAKASSAMINTKVQMMKSLSPIHYGTKGKKDYRMATDSEYSDFANNGVTLSGGSHSTALQVVSNGISMQASSISSASSSVAQSSFATKYYLTSFYVGNASMPGLSEKQARKQLIERYLSESDRNIFERIRAKLDHFAHEHRWALNIAKKLQHYHYHLKKLFKIFRPDESDKHLDQWAMGTRYFKDRPKERQESVLFRLEDSHAKDLTNQAQNENRNVYSANRSYSASSEGPDPFDDEL